MSHMLCPISIENILSANYKTVIGDGPRYDGFLQNEQLRFAGSGLRKRSNEPSKYSEQQAELISSIELIPIILSNNVTIVLDLDFK